MPELNATPPSTTLPASDSVVLFDGVCRLCSAWARFLIRFDTQHHFKLATVQSAAGKRMLAQHGFPTDVYNTMILVEGSQVYTQSTAFLRVMRRLPFPWPVAGIAWLIPRGIRDWLYDRIALNRYTLFGKYGICLLPTPDHASRFLDDQ